MSARGAHGARAFAALAALDALDAARAVTPSGARARALRYAGERLGDRLRAAPAARRIEVIAIERVPCALGVAFDGAVGARSAGRDLGVGVGRDGPPRPGGWIALERRMLFVEVELEGAPLRVLVDPIAPGAWERTPWGAHFVERYPRRARALRAGARGIEAGLASIGVAASDIEVAILTTLRDQDLRLTVGTARGDGIGGPRASVLPEAAWVVTRAEWESAHDPHEHERPRLVRDGMDRVDASRVRATETDLALGASAALIATPGLTAGHASFAVRGPDGMCVWSGHGVAPDAWAPYHGRYRGLRERVRALDHECVPRGDAACREAALTSMSVERAIADRSAISPAFSMIYARDTIAP